MKEKDPFWMLWCDGGRNPTFRHMTLGSAQAEAERLATADPGRKFYVLQAVGVAVREGVTFYPISDKPHRGDY